MDAAGTDLSGALQPPTAPEPAPVEPASADDILVPITTRVVEHMGVRLSSATQPHLNILGIQSTSVASSLPSVAPPILRSVAAGGTTAPESEGAAASESEYSEYKFSEIDTMIDKAFKYKESNNSLICDILAMYLKGQKILYTEAKTHCEQRLNFLMLPAIFITALCTILSLVLKDISYGATIVSSLNGINAFILALINYLKLDARAEAHRVSAYKFDKIQSYVEFNAGKILFMTSASDELGEIMKKVQHDVNDIKETNQFILPEKIRYSYPNLHNTNIFTEVKHIQYKEMRATNQLKNMYNDELAVRARVEKAKREPDSTGPVKTDLDLLESIEFRKRIQMDKIIRILDEYLDLDKAFEEEMRLNRNIQRGVQLCGWLKM
jgi:hypothetical protein